MKYGYTELIKDSKCNTCVGRNRLLNEEFKGVYRCLNYAKGVTKE